MEQDEDSSFQELLDEIDREARDAADAYFSDLYNACHSVDGEITAQRVSSLLAKLEVDPEGNFPISEHSLYRDGRWTLLRSDGFSDIEISIERSPQNVQGLKRALCYHLIPAFHPIGTIRSFRSTESYIYGFGYLERLVFASNHLGDSAEHISAISAATLNDALDEARDLGASNNYSIFFFLVCFWIFLSSSRLIPAQYCLDVKLGEVDTLARRDNVQELIRSTFVGWKPYSDDELKNMLTYAFFWIDNGVPTLNEALEFCRQNPSMQTKHHQSYNEPDLAFERLFGTKKSGIEIIGFSRNSLETKYFAKRLGARCLVTYQYYWMRHYAQAVDRVRNAIFILFCVMTGLRKRELAPLTFDDVYKGADGVWRVSFVRYKTSNDPNYFGDADEITLPDYLGEAIASYRNLRDFRRYMQKGYLFETVNKGMEVNKTDRMIEKLARNLSAEVGVDGMHVHRFRKTIAEILINQSERNIDLIRMIFGHSSYTMGMRYIARNPFLVASVVETLKEHFAKDFVDILSAMSTGIYAGEAANNLAVQMNQRPDLFVGKILKTTVLQYVTHMFEGGAAFMVQRTALRTFCMSGLVEADDSLPPCLAHRENLIFPLRPDVSNCQIHCSRNLVLESATSAIEQNLKFYRSIKASAGRLSGAALFELDQKIAVNEKLLDELSQPKPPGAAKKAFPGGKK